MWSDRVAAEPSAQRTVRRLPPNFETPELLIERNKPRLQRSLQDTAAASFGPVPFTGPEVVPIWLAFLDLYAKLQREVDRHVGAVLQALHSRPEVAANTIVVFTSDHGEYGASHGLRGKGAGAYEEAIRVPLIVKDLRGKLAAAPRNGPPAAQFERRLAPLLLTLATGSNDWRSESHYAHLAGRLDLAAILADPEAPRAANTSCTPPTRPSPSSRSSSTRPTAPLHVVAMRTPEAKFALYSHWPEEGIEPLTEGRGNRALRLHHRERAPRAAQRRRTHAAGGLAARAAAESVRPRAARAAPERLQAAHGRGFADYFSTARSAAAKATVRRKAKVESIVGDVSQGEGGPAPRERRQVSTRRAGDAPRTAPVALSACTLT